MAHCSNLTRGSMHRGAWRATVHAVAKSQTQQSDFHPLGVCNLNQYLSPL